MQLLREIMVNYANRIGTGTEHRDTRVLGRVDRFITRMCM